jgi:hypothetical protein
MKLNFSEPGFVQISMPRYINELLAANPHITTSRKTSSPDDLFLIDPESPLLEAEEKEWFHSTVALLLYVSTRVRKDISVPVGFLCTRVLHSTKQDSAQLDHLLKYINGTKDLSLRLGGENSGFIPIYVFADASYGVHYDAKSHTGITLSLGSGSVLSKSTKQKTVARSTAESELIATSDAVASEQWLRQFLTHQGYELKPSILREDNQAAIQLAKHGRATSEKTRHIKIRYFFVKQFLDSGELVIEHCPTDRMVADILTKPLQGDQFLRIRDLLLGHTPV